MRCHKNWTSVWSKLIHPVTFHTLAHCFPLMSSIKWWNLLLGTPQILRNIRKWTNDMRMLSLHFWEAATFFWCALLFSLKWFLTFLHLSNYFSFSWKASKCRVALKDNCSFSVCCAGFEHQLQHYNAYHCLLTALLMNLTLWAEWLQVPIVATYYKKYY